MAFQTKDFVSIVAGMINHLRSTTTKVTDFNVGSVARTLIESPAIEMDQVYQQMANGIFDAIPVACYLAFDFDLLAPTFAVGSVTFSTAAPATADINIAQGTRVARPGVDEGYVTAMAATIALGQTSATAPIIAEAAGSTYNVGAGEITAIEPAISGVSVTNPGPLTTGSDAETADQRRQRFLRFIEALSRAPAFTVEYGAETAALTDASGNVTERVVTANVVEPYIADSSKPLGKIDCYVYNGAAGASAALVEQAQRIVDGYIDDDGAKVVGYKAAGIICTVTAVTTVAVDVSAQVTLASGYMLADVDAPAQAAAGDYLQALPIGAEVVSNALVDAIMDVPGVYDITSITPAANVAGSLSVKSVPGTVTITQTP